MNKMTCAVLLIFALSSCAVRGPDIPPPSSSVTRQEAAMISDAYTGLRWRPGRSNVYHRTDPSGIRVDTPDRKWNDHSSHLWVPGQWTYGMAYKWGGFDTPREFMVKIQSTYHPALVRNPAGDMATPEKIRLGDEAVSPYAAGIDCSGFVSRCWRLDRPYSTRELPALCRRLDSLRDLKTGDILIEPGVHVIMFLKWVDAKKTKLIASEAGNSRYWRTINSQYTLDEVARLWLVPMQYVNMK